MPLPLIYDDTSTADWQYWGRQTLEIYARGTIWLWDRPGEQCHGSSIDARHHQKRLVLYGCRFHVCHQLVLE